MSITTEARKEALAEYTGSPISMIEDVNFENVFFDGVHQWDPETEKPHGFYLVLHKSERDYLKAIGARHAIGKQDGFYFFITDKRGIVDLEATEIVRQIEADDEKRLKTFEATFYNESAGWKKQMKKFRALHEQDVDTHLHDWADKQGIEIDVIEIKTVQ